MQRLEQYGFPSDYTMTIVHPGEALGAGRSDRIFETKAPIHAMTWMRLGISVKWHSVHGERFSCEYDPMAGVISPAQSEIFSALVAAHQGKAFPLDDG